MMSSIAKICIGLAFIGSGFLLNCAESSFREIQTKPEILTPNENEVIFNNELHISWVSESNAIDAFDIYLDREYLDTVLYPYHAKFYPTEFETGSHQILIVARNEFMQLGSDLATFCLAPKELKDINESIQPMRAIQNPGEPTVLQWNGVPYDDVFYQVYINHQLVQEIPATETIYFYTPPVDQLIPCRKNVWDIKTVHPCMEKETLAQEFYFNGYAEDFKQQNKPEIVYPVESQDVMEGEEIIFKWKGKIDEVLTYTLYVNDKPIQTVPATSIEYSFSTLDPILTPCKWNTWQVIARYSCVEVASEVTSIFYKSHLDESYASIAKPTLKFPFSSDIIGSVDVTFQWDGIIENDLKYTLYVNDEIITSMDAIQSSYLYAAKDLDLTFCEWNTWYVKAEHPCFEAPAPPLSFYVQKEYSQNFLNSLKAELLAPLSAEKTLSDRILFRWKGAVLDQMVYDIYVNGVKAHSVEATQTSYEQNLQITNLFSCNWNSWYVVANHPCFKVSTGRLSFFYYAVKFAQEKEVYNTMLDFFDLAENSNGGVTQLHSRKISEIIDCLLESILVDDMDILFLIDRTSSMDSYIDDVKKDLQDIIDKILTFNGVRTAIALYADSNEEPKTWFNSLDFSEDYEAIRTFINDIFVYGGGDLPESVYDAIWKSVDVLSWSSDTMRIIFIIADAPPLTGISSDYTYDEVVQKCASEEIQVNIYPIIP